MYGQSSLSGPPVDSKEVRMSQNFVGRQFKLTPDSRVEG